MDANLIDTATMQERFLFLFEYLKKEMVAEFVKQGHNVTGSLIQSIEAKIVRSVRFVRLDVEYNFYGQYVDRGRPAGLRRVPIQALEEWIKLKGFETDAKKIKGIAFAIQKTIFEKGISQPRSWKGESTKGWQTKILEQNVDKISEDINKAITDSFNLTIDNWIRQISKQTTN